MNNRYRMEVNQDARWYKVFDTTMYRMFEENGVKVLQHYAVAAHRFDALVASAAREYDVAPQNIKNVTG